MKDGLKSCDWEISGSFSEMLSLILAQSCETQNNLKASLKCLSKPVMEL